MSDIHVIPSSGPWKITTFEEHGDPAGYQQISVGSTAVSLSIPSGTNPNRVIIQCETQGNIKWRDDGGAPTSAIGMTLYAGNAMELGTNKSIKNLQMISDSAATVTVDVTYYEKKR